MMVRNDAMYWSGLCMLMLNASAPNFLCALDRPLNVAMASS